ncbi:MAG: bifunctional chorismate mutase/prephenate dehydratase [Ruminococcaceae bacterium]|nr:bifunctional chorismate mutase/prephenate dehydratase [Oscillospiraceae bacterium]
MLFVSTVIIMAETQTKLETAREIIDSVDRKMAELFARRMEAVKLVAEHKAERGLPIFDEKREEQVIRKNSAFLASESEAVRTAYLDFLRDTMGISKKYQEYLLSGMKIAYCGTAGAFAQIASSKIFPSAECIGYQSFNEAYDAVASGECHAAVLPFENSSAGEVGQVADILFSGSLYVTGAYDLSVSHDLLVIPGTTIDEITDVVSHPQALAQCDPYIRKHGWTRHEYANTAKAAELVSKNGDKKTAAIGSREAGELFGLETLDSGINEANNNTTRFVTVSKVKNTITAGRDMDARFILSFTVKNEAGSLAKAIEIIGKHGYNMQSIRSRPMKELLWQYYFLVECEGRIDGDNGSTMLSELSGWCDLLKVIGSYLKY